MEMKLFRVILNKTKDRIRNNNIRLELGVDELKNGIQKSRLRWFGQGMQMGEERTRTNMLHTKMEGTLPRGKLRSRWIDRIRKDIEMRGGNWKVIKEKGKWETAISLETT
jgi:hypothetical protein